MVSCYNNIIVFFSCKEEQFFHLYALKEYFLKCIYFFFAPIYSIFNLGWIFGNGIKENNCITYLIIGFCCIKFLFFIFMSHILNMWLSCTNLKIKNLLKSLYFKIYILFIRNFIFFYFFIIYFINFNLKFQ